MALEQEGARALPPASRNEGKGQRGKLARWFDAAEAGNRLTVPLVRHSERKLAATYRRNRRNTAPVLDPADKQEGETGDCQEPRTAPVFAFTPGDSWVVLREKLMGSHMTEKAPHTFEYNESH